MTATTQPTEPRTTQPRTTQPFRPTPSIENCDALMISLASQRFVIVRRDDRIRIWPADQLCRPVRTLQPGERVYYNGRLDTVRALTVY